MIQILGPQIVTVPGTPIRATALVQTDAGGMVNETDRFTCHAALFQALPTNTGKVYIGGASLSRLTLADCAAILPIPTANSLPVFSISLTLSPAGVDLSELYIDADNANDGVLLTLLVT